MSTLRTARLTGLAYLALAVTGMLAFLLVRPRLQGETAAETLANLASHPGAAHLLVALELAVVIAQALAAIGFLALWRRDAPIAGAAIAGFGLMNAAAIMGSAAAIATATAVSADPTLAPAGDAAATAQLLFEVSDHAWGVGAVFFGLWLIPMGLAGLASRRVPRLLGWLLVAGGLGYVASALVGYGWADAPVALVDGLSLVATVGELWMVGYLLTVGLRPPRDAVAGIPAVSTRASSLPTPSVTHETSAS